MRFLAMVFLLVLLVSSALPVVAQDGEPLLPITSTSAAHLTQLDTLGHGQVVKAGWSPDHRFLAVAGVRGLWLYDATDLAAKPLLLDGLGKWTLQFAFSPDGSMVATSGNDGQLHVWSIDSSGNDATEVAVMADHKRSIAKIAFSPDGQRLATMDGIEIHVWPVTSIAASEPQVLAYPYDESSFIVLALPVSDIAFTPDSTSVAIMEVGEGVAFWDPDTMEKHLFFDVDKAAGDSQVFVLPTRFFFDPTGQHMVVDWAGTLVIVDMASGDFIDVVNTGGTLNDLTFSPDGSQLIYAWDAGNAHAVKVWDVESRQEVASLTHETKIPSLALSPDGTRLITIENYNVRAWDMLTYQEIPFPHDHSGPVWAIDFNSDGTRLAAATRNNVAQIYEPETGKLVQTLVGHAGPVTDVAYSPDGTYLATASGDQTIRLWDTQTYASFATLEGHENQVLKLALSPSGLELASGAWDNTVRLWDVSTQRETQILWELPKPEGVSFPEQLSGLVYSPDGRWLAAGITDVVDITRTHEVEVAVWDAQTKKRVALLSFRGGISGLAFDPDSSVLAISTVETEEATDLASAMANSLEGKIQPVEVTSTIWLWDVETQTRQQVFTQMVAQDSGLGRLVFSPDGSLIAGVESQRIRVWDVATGDELAVLEDSYKFTDLTFDAQGTRLASSGEDGVVCIWGIPAH